MKYDNIISDGWEFYSKYKRGKNMSIYLQVTDLWKYEYYGREVIEKYYKYFGGGNKTYHSSTTGEYTTVDITVYLDSDNKRIRDVFVSKYYAQPTNYFTRKGVIHRNLTQKDIREFRQVLDEVSITRADKLFDEFQNYLKNNPEINGKYIYKKNTSTSFQFNDLDGNIINLGKKSFFNILEMLYTFPIMMVDKSFINEHPEYFNIKTADLIWNLLTHFCLKNGVPAIGERSEEIGIIDIPSLKYTIVDENQQKVIKYEMQKEKTEQENKIKKREAIREYKKLYSDESNSYVDNYFKELLFFHEYQPLSVLCEKYGVNFDFNDFSTVLMDKFQRSRFSEPDEKFVDLLARNFQYANTSMMDISYNIDISGFFDNLYYDVTRVIFTYGSKETCLYALENYQIANNLDFLTSALYDKKKHPEIEEYIYSKSVATIRKSLDEQSLEYNNKKYDHCLKLMVGNPFISENDVIQALRIFIKTQEDRYSREIYRDLCDIFNYNKDTAITFYNVGFSELYYYKESDYYKENHPALKLANEPFETKVNNLKTVFKEYL